MMCAAAMAECFISRAKQAKDRLSHYRARDPPKPSLRTASPITESVEESLTGDSCSIPKIPDLINLFIDLSHDKVISRKATCCFRLQHKTHASKGGRNAPWLEEMECRCRGESESLLTERSEFLRAVNSSRRVLNLTIGARAAPLLALARV